MQELHEVSITGLACITPLGDFTLAAPPMRGTLSTERPENGEIPEFRLDNYLTSSKTYLDRCSALALAGCAHALRDAGIPLSEEIASRAGITLGTHLGCLATMKAFYDKVAANGARVANSIHFSHSYFNSPISLCAIEFGLKGYHTTVCSGENGAIDAIRTAYDAIRLGHADIMLCGGVEALTPERRLFEPQQAPGEAAVFVVLENTRVAQERGAANSVALGEVTLHAAAAHQAEAASLFGHCGAATSGLAFALTLPT